MSHPSLLFCFILINGAKSICELSYVTKCDSLSDLKNIDLWTTEVIIGSAENPSKNYAKLDLSELLFKLDYIKSVTIISQTDQISSDNCSFKSKLTSLNFYKNDILELTEKTLPPLSLERLSLVDNNIATIRPGALNKIETQILDLSNNQIRSLEVGAFPKIFKMKILIVKNNRLEEIEPEALDDSLEVLILDNNRLSYLQEGVIENLEDLKVLSVKFNRLIKIPDLKDLKQIQTLDFSQNHINTLDIENFGTNYKTLKYLDLTFNKISSEDVLENLLAIKSDGLRILLAFNNLASLNFSSGFNESSLGGLTLSLYGNPWNCEMFNRIESMILKYVDQCDLKFFKGGTPYCVSYSDAKFSHQEKLIGEYFVKNTNPEMYAENCKIIQGATCNDH